MTLEMWYAVGILVAALILFVTEWVRVDMVAVGVVLALMLTGLLTTSEALAGFSNSAVLTIAALFIVGGAILHTGLAGLIGRRILAIAGSNEVRLILVIMLAVAVLSSFMSSTGAVAVLLPAIIGLARSADISPSKLLIPLSFGSLLGGATTLIGTPPNIIVSDLLRDAGYEPFNFFSYTPIGLMLLAAGVLFMITIGRRVLPDTRPSQQEMQRVESFKDLIELHQLGDNLFRLRLRQQSPLAGQTIADSELRKKFRVTVVEILRVNGRRPDGVVEPEIMMSQPSVSTVNSIFPQPETKLNAQDVLLVRGSPEDVQHAAAYWNLAIQPAQYEDQQSLVNEEVGIAEVIVPPRSSLNNKTLEETRFGPSYALNVLHINRPGTDEQLDLKDTVLQFGDMLLVQGSWKNIMALRNRGRDFVVIGQPETMIGAANPDKAPLALIIMAVMLVVMMLGVLPLVTASLLAAVAMVLSGCLNMDEAYDSIDWRSIVLIAGMLPMATALENVGLVDLAAQWVTLELGAQSPVIILGGLFLMTSFFTQILSNTATTVLVAPIALATAGQIGVDPHIFMLSVAVAASMAFASPVASPTNTLVLGAGNYRFADYIKLGLPMILIMLLITVIFLPLLMPITPL
jgi:di/tricarboxylate transporter